MQFQVRLIACLARTPVLQFLGVGRLALDALINMANGGRLT